VAVLKPSHKDRGSRCGLGLLPLIIGRCGYFAGSRPALWRGNHEVFLPLLTTHCMSLLILAAAGSGENG